MLFFLVYHTLVFSFFFFLRLVMQWLVVGSQFPVQEMILGHRDESATSFHY